MASVLLAILGISVLMIVHEAGHYAMARLFGMRVTTFSIGFGPALVKVRPKKSPTTFQIGVIPFMAYVRIAGMNPLEDEDPKDTGLYKNKSAFARGMTLLGGPLANYLFAAVVVFLLAVTGWREDVPSSPMVVESVAESSPAAAAGMRAGDTIVEIDGLAVRDITTVTELTSSRNGKPTTYVVERAGAERTSLTVVPHTHGDRVVIGVTAKHDTRVERQSIGRAAKLAVLVPWALTQENVAGIADLVKRRTTQGVTGPVGMAKVVASQADRGAYAFFAILVALSVALGLFNILPLPFLDGGRLLFIVFEVATGRRANPTAEMIVHAAGMLLLLGVAAAVTWRDIVG